LCCPYGTLLITSVFAICCCFDALSIHKSSSWLSLFQNALFFEVKFNNDIPGFPVWRNLIRHYALFALLFCCIFCMGFIRVNEQIFLLLL
jgi:hypothetical protein